MGYGSAGGGKKCADSREGERECDVGSGYGVGGAPVLVMIGSSANTMSSLCGLIIYLK